MYDILALYCKGTTMLFKCQCGEPEKPQRPPTKQNQNDERTPTKTHPRRRKQQTQTGQRQRPETNPEKQKQKKSKGPLPRGVTNPARDFYIISYPSCSKQLSPCSFTSDSLPTVHGISVRLQILDAACRSGPVRASSRKSYRSSSYPLRCRSRNDDGNPFQHLLLNVVCISALLHRNCRCHSPERRISRFRHSALVFKHDWPESQTSFCTSLLCPVVLPLVCLLVCFGCTAAAARSCRPVPCP